MNLNEILKKHNIENADLTAEIESYVSETIKTDKNSIPQSRFSEVIKERNEANARLTELNIEIESLKKNQEEFETFKTKYEEAEKTLNNYKESELAKKRETFKPIFDFLKVTEENPQYEKSLQVRDLFQNLPDKIEDVTDEILANYQNSISYVTKNKFLENDEINGYSNSRGKDNHLTPNKPIIDPFLQTQLEMRNK